MSDVKRLLEEATPLPWRHGPLFWEGWSVSDNGGVRVFEVPHVYPQCESPDAPGHEHAHQPGVYVDPHIGRSREPDAALIVYAVNRLPDYEAVADALWRVRTHELNVDGSPCWCPTELEPDEHEQACLNARAALRRLRGDA